MEVVAPVDVVGAQGKREGSGGVGWSVGGQGGREGPSPLLVLDLGSGSLAAGPRTLPATATAFDAAAPPPCSLSLPSVQLGSVIAASQRGQPGKAPAALANGSAGAAAIPNVEWLKFGEKSWPGLGPVSEELGPRSCQGDFWGGIRPMRCPNGK